MPLRRQTQNFVRIYAGMSKRVRGWPAGTTQALADQPSRQASSRAATAPWIAAAMRADHHEDRDDAGADNLRPRHREAVVGVDRLAVPVEPAVAVDRQPAEIGHVDRMRVAALRLGLRLGRLGGLRAAADRRCCRPNRCRANWPARIVALRRGAVSLLRFRALMKAGKRLIACHVSRLAAGSQSARGAADACRGGQLAATSDSLGRDVRPLRRLRSRPGSRSEARRSCSPNRARRRSRRSPCRRRRSTTAEDDDERAELLPARQRQMLLLDRGGHHRRRGSRRQRRRHLGAHDGKVDRGTFSRRWYRRPARARPRSSPVACGRRARRLARSRISIERSSELDLVGELLGLRVVADQLAVPVEPAAVVDRQAIELRRRQRAKLLRPLGRSRALRRHDAGLVAR